MQGDPILDAIKRRRLQQSDPILESIGRVRQKASPSLLDRAGSAAGAVARAVLPGPADVGGFGGVGGEDPILEATRQRERPPGYARNFAPLAAPPADAFVHEPESGTVPTPAPAPARPPLGLPPGLQTDVRTARPTHPEGVSQTGPPEMSLAEEGARSVGRFVASTIPETVGGAAGAIGSRLRQAGERMDRNRSGPSMMLGQPGELSPLERAGAALTDIGQRARESDLLRPSESVAGKIVDLKNPRWWAANAPEAIAQLGMQAGLAVLATPLGPAAQFAAFAAPTAIMEGGSQFNDILDAARAQGVPEEQARSMASGAAIATGLVNTVLERLPFEAIVMDRIPGADKLVANIILRRVAKLGFTAATESIEEMAQEVSSSLIRYAATEDPAAFLDLGSRMVAGGALGAVAGGIAGSVSPTRQRPVVSPDEMGQGPRPPILREPTPEELAAPERSTYPVSRVGERLFAAEGTHADTHEQIKAVVAPGDYQFIPIEDGFWTSHGRFVTREEAAAIERARGATPSTVQKDGREEMVSPGQGPPKPIPLTAEERALLEPEPVTEPQPTVEQPPIEGQTTVEPEAGPAPSTPVEKPATAAEPPAKKRPRTTASDYLGEIINYGGEAWTRGDVIRQMQQDGQDQAVIDRYMQGAKAVTPEEAASLPQKGELTEPALVEEPAAVEPANVSGEPAVQPGTVQPEDITVGPVATYNRRKEFEVRRKATNEHDADALIVREAGEGWEVLTKEPDPASKYYRSVETVIRSDMTKAQARDYAAKVLSGEAPRRALTATERVEALRPIGERNARETILDANVGAGDFVGNGHLLIRKSLASDARLLGKVEARDPSRIGLSPRPVQQLEKVWASIVNRETEPVDFVGEEFQVAYGVRRETGGVVVVNADYLALLSKIVQPTELRVGQRDTDAVWFMKGKDVAAVLMPRKYTEGPSEREFSNVLTAKVGSGQPTTKKRTKARRGEGFPARRPAQGTPGPAVDLFGEPIVEPDEADVEDLDVPENAADEAPPESFPAAGQPGGDAIGYGLTGQLISPDTEVKPIHAPKIMDAMVKLSSIAYRTFGRPGAGSRRAPIRTGGVGNTFLGFWMPSTHVIRLRRANDISTAAHELGHAFEWIRFVTRPKGGNWQGKKGAQVQAKMQKELAALGRALYGDRKPNAGYKSEGWAEFWRIWLTEGTDQAKQKAPLTSEWVDQVFLADHDDLRSGLEDVQGLVDRFRSQGSTTRARQGLVDTASVPARLRASAHAAGTILSMESLVEQLQPFWRLSRAVEARRGGRLRPSDDPYYLGAALRLTHASRARYFVEQGPIDIRGQPVPHIQPLTAVRPLIQGRYEDFLIYLWARRAIALGEGRPAGLSLEDADQIIGELGSAKFRQAAEITYAWSDAVLDYAAQGSPLFKQIVQRVRAADPGAYVPLQREFEQLDKRWGSSAAGPRSPVKRLKGSGRRVKDPLVSVIGKAESIIRATHRRMVLDSVLRLASQNEIGDLIEEVPPTDVKAGAWSIEQLIRAANKELKGSGLVVDLVDREGQALLSQGFMGSALDSAMEEMVTLFAPFGPGRSGETTGESPIVPLWDGKKLRYFVVPLDLYNSLEAMDVYRLPRFLEATLGTSAGLLRSGTTGMSASFGLVMNPARDLGTFMTLSKTHSNPLRLGLDWLQALTTAALFRASGGRIQNTAKGAEMVKWMDLFMRLGGEMAQPLGQDIPHTRRVAHRLAKPRLKDVFHNPKLFSTWAVRTLDPRDPYDFYRDLIQFPESAPRLAEMKRLASEIGWEPGQPMTLDQSLELLLAAKQVTVDFSAAGQVARVVNRIVPFHNAAIQGPRAMARAFQRDPAITTLRGLLLLTVPTLLLWWKNKDEEWYRELRDFERFLYWHETVEMNGRPELLRIPRPFDVGLLFSGFFEATFDAGYLQMKDDPDAMRSLTGFMETLGTTMMPNLTPPLVEEALEQKGNRDSFTGAPIESRSQQMRRPEERYDEYTTEAAKFIGRMLNVSPERVDHAIRGQFGGVGAGLVQLVAGAEGKKGPSGEPADLPIIGRLFQRGGPMGYRSIAIDDLYERLERAGYVQHSLLRDETEDERQARLQLSDAAQAISSLLTMRSLSQDPEERRLYAAQATRVARAAIEADRSGNLDRELFADLRTTTGTQSDEMKARRLEERANEPAERGLLSRLIGRTPAVAETRRR